MCTQVQQVRLSAAAAEHFGARTAFEHNVVLHTGRTHQIRAQFAAQGCPLLGDNLYRLLAQYGALQVASAPTPLPPACCPPCPGPGSGSSHSNAVSAADALGAGGTEPSTCSPERNGREWWQEYRQSFQHDAPLGLQAARLSIYTDAASTKCWLSADAGAPWWQDK